MMAARTQHGGQIVVGFSSWPSRPADAIIGAMETGAVAIRNRNLRVLLVDDHQTVRQGLRALFQSVSDVDVVHDVADGDAAIEAIRTLAPDLVVIDLSMTPTDGLSVLRRAKQARRQTKFVVLTRYREAGYVREAIASGAIGYVLKQSPFNELTRALAAAARGERHIDSAIQPSTGSENAGSLDAPLAVSGRELDVLRRAALGQTNIEIASTARHCGQDRRTAQVEGDEKAWFARSQRTDALRGAS